MKLYLTQHALSKPKEENPGRSISNAGRAETETVAEYFRTLDPDLHVLP